MIQPSTNPVTLPFGSTAPPYGPGNEHRGVDFAPDPDPTIYAPFAGPVTLRPNNGADGNGCYMYENGRSHGLLHCERYLVASGQYVQAGQPIAIMGWTGRVVPADARGRHLHWCVKQDGRFINPLSLLPAGKGAAPATNERTDTMTDEGILHGYLAANLGYPTSANYAYWRGRPSAEFTLGLYNSNELPRWKANNYDRVVGELAALKSKPPEVVVKEVEKIVESCKLPTDLTPAESSKFRGILLWLADKLVK